MVDEQWGVEQLRTFIAKIEEMSTLYQTIHTIGADRPDAEALGREIGALEDELCQLEPAVQIVMDAVDPDLRDYQHFDPDLPVLHGGLAWNERWLPARTAALKAVGLHTIGAEAKRRMRPDYAHGSRSTGIEGYTGADFELRWPKDLFVREAEALIARGAPNFDQQCEWLLTEAFVGATAADAARASQVSADPWGGSALTEDRPRGPKEILSQMVREVDQLREASVRRPYWSQRRHSTTPSRLDVPGVARQFVRIVGSLQASGYFEKEFPTGCVDDQGTEPVDAEDVLTQMVGIPGLRWPLSANQLLDSTETLFDVIEAVHDLVARPRSRSFHDYAGCGWHYSEFAIEPARVLYRWRVNQLLEHSKLGIRLADEGEDVGRLVTVTDDARADLVATLMSRPPDYTSDRIRHSIALFRARGATEHDKRSAILVLAGIIEERREFLRDKLIKKDEGALFEIANRFALRHQNPHQQRDYDPAFLDWIFWWYLATVELTNQLLARPAL